VQLELNKAASDAASWLYGDDDYRGQRYELDQINAERVPGLAFVSTYSFPKSEGSETASIVYGGTLYAATAHYAGALNYRQNSSREVHRPECPVDPRLVLSGHELRIWAMHSHRSDSRPLGGPVIGGDIA
jgi:hypothetical protein